MPLIDLWRSNPDAIAEMSIEQIVSAAGDGALKDGSKCSEELRLYFRGIETQKIAAYVDHCLSNSFSRSGMVLQDLINELGWRLDYDVENGRYQGVSNAIGFDGLWRSPELHSIVVEVKTSDVYRIPLGTITGYRRRLTSEGRLHEFASSLIVVGRQDTGELEAQVRGSRHAWDIRIISADALIKLVQLKENSEGGSTAKKIRTLLTPMEYTRLDDMVDVMFTTATEVESAASEAEVSDERDEKTGDTLPEKTKGIWQFTDSELLHAKRKEIIKAVSLKLGVDLLNKTKATLWSSDRTKRAAVTISKRYPQRTYPYWYAYHPQWDDFLAEDVESLVVLGCMDLPIAFAIPRAVLIKNLDKLSKTVTSERMYWHLNIAEDSGGSYALLLSRAEGNLDLLPYKLPLD